MGNDEDSLKLCEKEIAEDNRYFDEVVRNCFTKNLWRNILNCTAFMTGFFNQFNIFDGKSILLS